MHLDNRRTVRRALLLLVGLCALALHAGAADSAPSRCATGDLTLSFGPRIAPETGEHGLVLRVTNRAERPCTLFGYPGVSFYRRLRLLPFKSVWGGEYGTGGKPRTVVLHSGDRASFIVAKYRCDIGIVATATAVRVYPPNTTRQLRLRLPRARRTIDYCRAFRGPNRDDPGNTLNISPVSRANYPYTPD